MPPAVLSGATELPANWVIVSGSSSSELAKIGGITPAVLILSGRWLRSACIMPFWRGTLGILDQQASLRPLHEADEQDQPHDQHDQPDDR